MALDHKESKSEGDPGYAGNQVITNQRHDSEACSPRDERIHSPQSSHALTSSEKPKDWHKIITLAVEIMGLTALIVYTVFSVLQWAQIRWTNKLTREALDGNNASLQQTLIKMQGQIDATNRLYGEAQRQTGQATILANNSGKQVFANEASANATKSVADTASNQLKVAQQQFHDSQRPWLFLDLNAEKLTTDDNKAAIEVHFVASNVGQSIARTVVISVMLLPYRAGIGRECELPSNVKEDWDARKYGTVIFPGKPFSGDRYVTLPLTKTIWPDPNRGTNIDVIGCAYYESTVDNLLHYTKIYKHVFEREVANWQFNPQTGTHKIELVTDESRTQAD